MKFNIATAALLTATGLVIVLGSPPTTAGSPLDACVEKYTSGGSLNPGQVAVVDQGVVKAVGGKGIAIANSSEGEVQITPGDDSDPEGMAKAYAAQGRSVLDDARAAGVSSGLVRKLCAKAMQDGPLKLVATSGDGVVTNSICVHDDKDYVEWDACVVRYHVQNDGDPDYSYGVDDTQAWGHETETWAWLGLKRGGVKNAYAYDWVDILKASPSSDRSDLDSCVSASFSVGIKGFSVSASGDICPDKWDVTRPDNNGATYHKVEWQGDTKADREVNALTASRVVPGFSTGYSLIINWATG